MSVSIETLPKRIFSDGYGESSRIKVDDAQTSFYDGRQFRIFREFSQPLGTHIPTGQNFLLRFIAGINTVITEFQILADNGFIRITAWAAATPTGVFSETPTIFATNSMTDTPVYTTANAVAVVPPNVPASCNVTGTQTSLLRLRVANATGGATSNNVGETGFRGLPPGTYYILIQNIGSGDFEGVLNFRWEERPVGV